MQEQGNGLKPISVSTVKMLNNAAERYRSALSRDAAEWLLARGIDRAVASTFRLGVVTDPLPGHERFKGMISIPYFLGTGDVTQMRFRCILPHEHDGHGKYNSVKGARPALYNIGVLDHMGPNEDLHLCEGEADAWILTKCGFKAIGIPGAHLWQAHFRNVLDNPSRIWMWGDPDDAGRDLTQKIVSQLNTAIPVPLEHGDVGETYLAGGKDALVQALNKAKEWSK